MIYHGDCLEVMAGMEAESVDAVVTDPPYGLEFMGKEWDKLDAGLPQENVWKGRRGKGGSSIGTDDSKPQSRHHVGYGGGQQGFKRCATCGKRAFSGSPCVCAEPVWVVEYNAGPPSSAVRMGRWHQQWAEAAYRVAKPSAYLLAFGGTRTVHRLACAIEDAGWIIRDTLVWAYAQGFPKSQASLKPAWEPIVMARKPGPLRMLAIDACRIPTDDTYAYPNGPGGTHFTGPTGRRSEPVESSPLGRWPANVILTATEDGRAIFDGGVEGVVGGGYQESTSVPGAWQPRGAFPIDNPNPTIYGDSGTYSRFFLIPKADRTDREPVLDEYAYRLHRERGECDKLRAWAGADLNQNEPTGSTSPARATSGATSTDGSSSATSPSGRPRTVPLQTDTTSTTGTATSRTTGSRTSPSLIPSPTSDSTLAANSETASGGSPATSAASSSGLGLTTGTSLDRDGRSTDAAARATSGSWSSRSVCGRCGKPLPRVGSHPTVKPVDLMRHLVRLVTPSGGVVLDPFLGSGTTAIAAEMEGFHWLGIEKELEYVQIAEARLNGTQRGLGLDSPAPTPRPRHASIENTTAKRAAYGRKPHEGSTWRLHGHEPIPAPVEESGPVDSVDPQLFAGMTGPAEGDEVA